MLPSYEGTGAFRSYGLLNKENLFAELLDSVRFEDVGKGRQGAVLINSDEAGRVPIVRTTTRYSTPAQRFRSVHEQLAERIRERASISLGFNNALIECYTNAYTTMGSHSDQALDLADGSSIALFSCYRHPERVSTQRALVVESKEPGGDTFEVPLIHDCVVVFSLDANKRFKHKIVLRAPARSPENQWLGITFRTSKTWVQLRGGQAHFADGTRLLLADDEERREFFRLRRRENDELDFVYPRLTYTISESDLLPPSPPRAPG